MGKIRLLSRREIDTAKAQDRSREVQEGAKLANRVDALRETVVSEEKGLEEFRSKTLSGIQVEIDTKIAERDFLVGVVDHLKAERAAALVPLDEKKALLEEKQRLLKEKEEEIAIKEGELKLAIGLNINREEQNQIETERIAEIKERTSVLMEQTARMNTRAATRLMQDSEKAKEIMSNAQAFEARVFKREKTVTLMEGLVEQRRKENEKQMIANNEERIRIRDAYRTLERIKERIK